MRYSDALETELGVDKGLFFYKHNPFQEIVVNVSFNNNIKFAFI